VAGLSAAVKEGVMVPTRGICIQCLLKCYLNNEPSDKGFVDSVEEHLIAYHANEEETIRERVELEQRLEVEKGMTLARFFSIVQHTALEMAARMAIAVALELEDEDEDVIVH
jgi:hypothetical protein